MFLDPWLTEPQSRIPLEELSERQGSSATLSAVAFRSGNETHSSNQTLGVLVDRSFLGEYEIVVENSCVHIGVVCRVEGSLRKR